VIYTVGNERQYDARLKQDRPLIKRGRVGSYPGGIACQHATDAIAVIAEFKQIGAWAVYSVDAQWDLHTEQSSNGWWHVLYLDAPVTGKIYSAVDCASILGQKSTK
jgi:hypothetical protein